MYRKSFKPKDFKPATSKYELIRQRTYRGYEP